ncbi:MAG TPA: nickel-binding protein [Thermoanaerobaculia bacterium]|nr:nickel-binding protein [Thermoanaerobaculia bacterium]
METVLVERAFEEAVRFEDLQRLEHESAWCLELHRVKFLHTYLSKDGKRMICVYEAPDAESVRLANETAKLPFERVYTVTRY